MWQTCGTWKCQREWVWKAEEGGKQPADAVVQIWEAETAHWNFDTFDRRAERHLVSSHLIASLVMSHCTGRAVKLLKRFSLSLSSLWVSCVTQNQKDIERSTWELDTCYDSNSYSMHGLPHTHVSRSCLSENSHRQATKKTNQNLELQRRCPVEAKLLRFPALPSLNLALPQSI